MVPFLDVGVTASVHPRMVSYQATQSSERGKPNDSSPSTRPFHFYRTIILGFWTLILISLLLIITSFFTFRSVSKSRQVLVYDLSDDLLALERIHVIAEKKVVRDRTYLFSNRARFLEESQAYRQKVLEGLEVLKNHAPDPHALALLRNISQTELEHHEAVQRLIAAGAAGKITPSSYEKEISPFRTRFDDSLTQAIVNGIQLVEEGRAKAERVEIWGLRLLLASGVFTVFLMLLLGAFGLRAIRRMQRFDNAILENEAYFRNLADETPAIIWAADEFGSTTYVSQRWLEFTSSTQSDNLGFQWLQHVHPQDVQRVKDVFGDAIRNRKPAQVTYRLRFKKRDYRWVISSGTPRFDAGGTFLGLIGAVMDIDPQKQAEKKLEEDLVARDEFISIASHELRTPLTSLKLHLQMTARKLVQANPSKSESLAEVCETSLRQVESLERVVDDLLDASRIRLGKISVRLSSVNLAELAEEVVKDFSEILAQSRCRLKLEIDRSVHGMWDRDRLTQALSNLILNACKYAPGEEIRVVVSQTSQSALLQVIDTGPGIPADRQKKVFERFERGGAEGRFAGGLGLGLYIAQGVVSAQKGKIYLQSSPGKGSSFTIELPLHPRSTT